MFNFSSRVKKTFYILFFFVFLIFLFSALIKPLFTFLRQPLILLNVIKREIRGIIFFHRNLIEVERLKKEIDFLNYKINSLQECSLENLRLKEILNLKNKSAFKVIASQVIGRPADSWSLALIIDKGSNHGITYGMSVINYLGLVGKVIQVFPTTSKVMLLADPNLRVAARVQRSRQEGLVCGTFGANLIMRYLPYDADVEVGDIIVTSGLDNFYPKGILIGKVIEVCKEFSGLSKYALIKPAVNFSTVEEVLVVFL